MSTMQLKGAEKLKIEYAKKHFEKLGNELLKYDVVATYEDLINKVLKWFVHHLNGIIQSSSIGSIIKIQIVINGKL